MEDGQEENSGSKSTVSPPPSNSLNGAGYSNQPSSAGNFSLLQNQPFHFHPTPYVHTPIQHEVRCNLSPHLMYIIDKKHFQRRNHSPYLNANHSPYLIANHHLQMHLHAYGLEVVDTQIPNFLHSPTHYLNPFLQVVWPNLTPTLLLNKPLLLVLPHISLHLRVQYICLIIPTKHLPLLQILIQTSDILHHNSSTSKLGKWKPGKDQAELELAMHPSSKACSKQHIGDSDGEDEEDTKPIKCAPSKASQASTAKAGSSKVKVKSEPKAKSLKGHTTGSCNFSPPKVHRLLRYINVQLPMGAKGWDLVVEKYNAWAMAREYS